ncbi:MAG: DUF2817 domain-containing protein [Bacteriovoracaceae bacterium]|nr:DUF2817 domain-containing protein [Bacteriovoracaceae bacterium]
MVSYVPELVEVERLAEAHSNSVQLETLGSVQTGNTSFPLLGLVIGSKDPKAPTCGLFAGVHGLERVGTHVLMSFLKTLFVKRVWDREWVEFFERNRLVTIPIINPTGFALNRRSNTNGVDLMRNAPVEAQGKLLPGVSGHRFSHRLPWFRGHEKLETETQAVADFVERHMFQSKVLVSLDLHSGFGMKDRLWHPWAHTQNEFPHSQHVQRLTNLFETTYPYHIYKIEPQNQSYMTHGDLWDWIYINHQKKHPGVPFLPLTLEMGSWMWVKKNPWQLLMADGLFNPVKKHRYARTMRRHLHLLEFLLKATGSSDQWL